MFYVPLNTDDWAIGFDAGTGPAERVRFKFNGQVGIGTAVPTGVLTVIPAGNPTTVATATQIQCGEASDNPGYRMSMGFATVASGSWAGVLQAIPIPTPIQIQPSGGMVGIGLGTTAPAYTLESRQLPRTNEFARAQKVICLALLPEPRMLPPRPMPASSFTTTARATGAEWVLLAMVPCGLRWARPEHLPPLW